MSDSCRGNDKPTSLMPQQSLQSLLVGVCFVALPAVTTAQSLVVDRVAHGEVNIQIGSQSTVIQTSNKAIIDWRNLSVGQGDSLNFVQPSSTAIALNRITGASVSQIDGLLNANGQVWVLNPNGVMIGKTGQINAAGFLASTMSISNEDFIQGKYQFTTPSGSRAAKVINLGSISTPNGYAILSGPQVINEGLIQANLGQVVLAAGNAMTLDLVGDKLLSFAITQPVSKLPDDGKAAIENSGQIFAQGGRVLMTARAATDMMHSVINTTGIVEATSAKLVNGEIVLDGGSSGSVNVAGALSVAGLGAGEKGGAIKVHGDTIIVGDGGLMNARGDAGGGTIYIGGGWQGERLDGRDPALRVAIAPTAALDASAVNTGNGGTIVVWSDIGNASSQTIAMGSFKAEGGVQAGDGGKIETSGYQLRMPGIRVSTLAPKGKTGEWLIDPEDITVCSSTLCEPAGYNQPLAVSSATDFILLQLTGSTVIIPDALLSSYLTTSNILLQATGDSSTSTHLGSITIQQGVHVAPLTSSSVLKSLTLDAYGDIKIDGSTIQLGGSFSASSANGSININGSYIQAGLVANQFSYSESDKAAESFLVSSNSISTFSEKGVISLTASKGEVSIGDLNFTSLDAGGNISINADTSISVKSASVYAGLARQENSYSASFNEYNDDYKFSSGYTVSVDPLTANGSSLVNFSNNGSILLAAKNSFVDLGNQIFSSPSYGYVSLNAGGNITIFAGGDAYLKDSTLNAGLKSQNFSYQDSTSTSANYFNGSNVPPIGQIKIDAGGAINISGGSTTYGGSSLSAGADIQAKGKSISLGMSHVLSGIIQENTVHAYEMTLPTLTSSGSITLGNDFSVKLVAIDGPISISGYSSVHAGGSVSFITEDLISSKNSIIFAGQKSFTHIDKENNYFDLKYPEFHSTGSVSLQGGEGIVLDMSAIYAANMISLTSRDPSNIKYSANSEILPNLAPPPKRESTSSGNVSSNNVTTSNDLPAELQKNLVNADESTIALVANILIDGGTGASDALNKILDTASNSGTSFQQTVTQKASEGVVAMGQVLSSGSTSSATLLPSSPTAPASPTSSPQSSSKSEPSDSSQPAPASSSSSSPSATVASPAASSAPAPTAQPTAAAPAPATAPASTPASAAPVAAGGAAPPPPVAPPPPSPVAAEKPPTPKDSSDAGDKTLSAAAPPPTPKPASQARAPATQVVAVSPVVSSQVPLPPRPPAGAAADQRVPATGNSARW